MPSQSKFVGVLACGAGAFGVSQVFTSMSAPRSAISTHSTTAAQGNPSLRAPLSGSAATAISGVAIAGFAAKASLAASKRRGKVSVMALAQDDELAFQPGQRVTLLAPPAMAGKQGTVLGPDLSDNFKVQLESGSVFSIATSNINGGGAAPAPAAAPAAAAPVASYTPAPAAAAPVLDDGELAFQPGERVTLLAPPAMSGKQGSVVGPALGDTFAVQLDSGSIFNIATDNLQGSAGGRAPAPAAAASYAPAAAATAAPAQGDDELAFQPGERVTILAPPAMAGKQATVVGPALDVDTFACQLDSGSVFNIATDNIQGAGGAAPAAAAAAAPVASYAPAAAAAPAQNDEELAFQPGEKVTLLAPPAMAGKQATVVGPALSDTFACQLDSGSIFNIAQHNIQGAGGYTPPAPAATPAAAAPMASYTPPPAAPSATQSGDAPEFENGQTVQILAPPALAGKQGTIGGPALDDLWKVVLASGSVFNIKTENLKVSVAA